MEDIPALQLSPSTHHSFTVYFALTTLFCVDLQQVGEQVPVRPSHTNRPGLLHPNFVIYSPSDQECK
jgi:hypothetical protein